MNSYARELLTSAKDIGHWRDLAFFGEPFAQVLREINNDSNDILPSATCVFAALKSVQPLSVRVVILGQDPYPTPGHGNGLAFSVDKKVTPIPRSLSNIFKEMNDDIGQSPDNGDLSHWATQGVLLLNSTLTVRSGEAGSHATIGWQALTREIVTKLADREALVWILWGKHAQAHKPLINNGLAKNSIILESAHPSPLSARRGFFGSKPFSRTNEYLTKHGHSPIGWIA